MTDRFGDVLNPAVDSSGNTISGARLFFYRVGTSTKKDTFSDSDKTVANANPVVADSGGRFGDIFMLTDEQYKVVLAPAGSDDPPTSPIDTWDNYSPIRSNPVADIEVISKAANYTVLTTDKGKWIEVDASSGAVTITLPAVADATNGFFVYVQKVDSSANAVTVDGNGAETINGSPTFELPNQYDTGLFTTDGTSFKAFVPALTTPLPTAFLNGLTLTADSGDTSNDVNITAGSARDGDDTENIILASEITKRIDAAWSVGDDQGGLDTGTVADGNRYYIWLIKRTDTDVEDALFSLSDSSPTMPSNYDKKRLIGNLDRVSSANVGIASYSNPEVAVLASGTVSAAASLDITDLPTGYRSFRLEFDNVSPVTDDVNWLVRTSNDNGASFDNTAGDYEFHAVGGSNNASTVGGGNGGGSATEIRLNTMGGQGNGSTEIGSGFIELRNPRDSGQPTWLHGAISYVDFAGVMGHSVFSGRRVAAQDVNAFQFFLESGNISSANWTLYGRRSS